jgi:hypothetical protein
LIRYTGPKKDKIDFYFLHAFPSRLVFLKLVKAFFKYRFTISHLLTGANF